jgi:hypothetical protein
VRETGVSQQVLDFSGGAAGRVRRGPGGKRGRDAMATRPPGASRRRSSASRSAGAGQKPRELTARMASKGPSRAGAI